MSYRYDSPAEPPARPHDLTAALVACVLHLVGAIPGLDDRPMPA